MGNIRENDFIEILTCNFKRSPLQKNRLQESDCELITIPGTNIIIALTTDSIVEEIETGLYSDPYQIGWMTVIVNLSDLAAVGAEPVGILLNETLPPGAEPGFISRLQQGIHDACNEHGIYILGGDTNFSVHMQMSGCAMGILRDGPALTRTECRPGDILFASGKFGLGNGYALLKMTTNTTGQQDPIEYKPRARIKEGQFIRKYADCCMDTSDGLIPAVDQLMRLNGTGFVFKKEIDQFIHPAMLKIALDNKIPPWMLLAGPHGEFELLFTVPAENTDSFTKNALSTGWEPINLGIVSEKQEIRFVAQGNQVAIDTSRIRNLFDEVGGDVGKYIYELYKMDYLWKPGELH